MVNSWVRQPVEDLVVSERGLAMGPFGSNIKRENFVSEGIPVLRGSSLVNNQFQDSDVVFVTEEKAVSLRSSEALRGDLVFTHRGTIGQVARIPDNARYSRYIVSQSQMRARFDPELVDGRFAYYWFCSREGQGALLANTSQVGVPAIAQPLASLRSIAMPVPPLDEQRRIAGVMGALDDLIEVNRSLIRELYELALARYAEVVALARETRRLGDLVTVNGSQLKPASVGTLTYLDIASVGDGTVQWPTPMPWANAPSRARRLATAGSTIWSTVRPNRRAHALLTHVPDDLVVSTGFAVLEPKVIGSAEVYCATNGDDFVDYLMSRADGSAYPAVRGSVFEDAQIPHLGAETSAKFENFAWPLLLAAGTLAEECRQLAAARDELLPLLMSGRVRVCDDGVAA